MPRLYDEPTVIVSTRLSHPNRNLLEWLAVQEGMTVSTYVRRVLETYLGDLGFQRVKDPLRGTPEGWVRDHTEHGEAVRPTSYSDVGFSADG
jgi:hypothetical protein